MGFFDFFKNIFGKKTCAFCGGECGVLSRTKIKGDEFICSKCDDMCSFYIKKSRFTKDDLKGHMEYMKRSDRIYKEIALCGEKSERFPSATSRQGIEFFDDIGMFRIIDGSKDNNERYPKEMFRYDQVSAYKPYINEVEKETEDGKKEQVFESGGIKISFIGAAGSLKGVPTMEKGRRSHPYIIDEITVCFASNATEKEKYLKYVDNAISHFNRIFGARDDENALLGFGMNKKEKRDLAGAIAFAKTVADSIEVAKNDGELSQEQKDKIQKNTDAINNANTNGLAEYTRRADAAEAKIQ